MTLPTRPSETTDFIRCPRLWLYKHVEGWEPPASAWTPERLIGTAIHAGVGAYWRGRGGSTDETPTQALRLALAIGWPLDAPLEFSQEALESHALKVLDKVLTWISKKMLDAEPVMVEQPLGVDGHTTPDLVTREPGGLTVTDWKYTHVLDPDRIRYRIEGIERTHQFLHYVWAVGQEMSAPVSVFRKVVIVGNPRIIIRAGTFTPEPAALEQWLASARQMWEDMTEMRAGRRVAYQRESGCFMYGPKWPCPMYEACWTCHGDREKMKMFYTRSAR